MPIVYCLIARGVVVECDVSHPLHSGNFKLVALKLLDKVHRQHEAASAPPASLHDSTSNPLRRQTLLFDHHTFNFLSLGPLHCLALCTADVKQHTAFLFLADVLETYRSGRGEDSGGRVDGHTLKAITDSLHSKMEQYNHSSTQHTDSSSQQQQQERRGEEADENQDRRRQRQQRDRKERERGGKHGGKSSKRPVFSSSPGTEGVGPQGEPTGDNPDAVHNVKRELESVKDTLLGNIDRVLSRGEALDSLVDRSDALHSSADQFKSASTRLQRQLRWQQIRTAITLLTMTAIILYFIAASRCGVTLRDC